jgi:hypothetical protein
MTLSLGQLCESFVRENFETESYVISIKKFTENIIRLHYKDQPNKIA